jgi:MFS family permease
MFIPLSANAHWIVFCILRFLVGLAHGTIWPCMTVIMSRWAPTSERGKLMGFMNAGNFYWFHLEFQLLLIGAQAGNVFALSIGGLMCSWDFAGGWPLIFYSTSKIIFPFLYI